MPRTKDVMRLEFINCTHLHTEADYQRIHFRRHTKHCYSCLRNALENGSLSFPDQCCKQRSLGYELVKKKTKRRGRYQLAILLSIWFLSKPYRKVDQGLFSSRGKGILNAHAHFRARARALVHAHAPYLNSLNQ